MRRQRRMRNRILRQRSKMHQHDRLVYMRVRGRNDQSKRNVARDRGIRHRTAVHPAAGQGEMRRFPQLQTRFLMAWPQQISLEFRREL